MKKTLFVFSLAAAAILPGLAFADVSSTTIQLPGDFTAVIWSNFNAAFAGLESYTNLLIGVILTLVVIGELIIMLRHPGK